MQAQEHEHPPAAEAGPSSAAMSATPPPLATATGTKRKRKSASGAAAAGADSSMSHDAQAAGDTSADASAGAAGGSASSPARPGKGGGTGTGARHGPRSSRACTRCSLKKIRCDGAGPPCGPCAALRIAAALPPSTEGGESSSGPGALCACAFNPNPKKRGPPRGFWLRKKLAAEAEAAAAAGADGAPPDGSGVNFDAGAGASTGVDGSASASAPQAGADGREPPAPARQRGRPRKARASGAGAADSAMAGPSAVSSSSAGYAGPSAAGEILPLPHLRQPGAHAPMRPPPPPAPAPGAYQPSGPLPPLPPGQGGYMAPPLGSAYQQQPQPQAQHAYGAPVGDDAAEQPHHLPPLAYGNGYAHGPYTSAYGHAHPQPHPHSHPHAHAHAHSHAHTHQYAHAHQSSHAHALSHAHAQGAQRQAAYVESLRQQQQQAQAAASGGAILNGLGGSSSHAGPTAGGAAASTGTASSNSAPGKQGYATMPAPTWYDAPRATPPPPPPLPAPASASVSVEHAFLPATAPAVASPSVAVGATPMHGEGAGVSRGSVSGGAGAGAGDETIDPVEWRLIETFVAFVHVHWPILAADKPNCEGAAGAPAAGGASNAAGARGQQRQSLVAYIGSLKSSNPILFNAALAVVSATFEADEDMKPRVPPGLDALRGRSANGGAGASGNAGANGSEGASTSSYLAQGVPRAERLERGGSIASARSSTGSGAPHDWSRSYAERCRAALLPLAHTRHLWVVQALVLLALADMGAGRGAQAFMLSGLACRLALDMNLHRAEGERALFADPARPRALIEEEVTLRRRTLWACYILDKISSCVTEKPPVLRTSDIDVPFPDTHTEDENELWLNTSSVSFVQHRAVPELKQARTHLISSFVAWAKLMIILEYILTELYSLAARRSAQATLGGDGRSIDGRDAGDSMEMKFRSMLRLLGEWAEELPPAIRWQGLFSSSHDASLQARTPGSNPHHGVPPNVLTLRAWASLCMLALHRPFIPRNASDDDHLSALSHPAQACIAAADEIINLVDAYESTFPVRKIPSGWVFLVFSAATIHSSFGVAALPQKPALSALVDAATQQQQYRQKYETAQHCQRQLGRCIERLGRISETHKGATPHVEILRSLADVRTSLQTCAENGEVAGAADPPAFFPAHPPQQQPGSAPGEQYEQPQHHHHQQQQESQRQEQQQVDYNGSQHPQQGEGSQQQQSDGMNERFVLEGFWNSMPFGESWDNWRSYFNHLQPLSSVPANFQG